MNLSFALRSSSLYPLPRKGNRSPLLMQDIRNFQECNFQFSRALPKHQVLPSKIIIRAVSHHSKNINIQKNSSIISAPFGDIKKFFSALYVYSRPYAMMGSFIGVTSLSLLPLGSFADVSSGFLVGVLKALAVFLWSQLYVSGINQVYDVEIDKINKPYLPLAAEAFSMKLGIAIACLSVFMSIFTAKTFGSPALVFGSMLYCLAGTVYSVELPFMRWKRSPILTAVLIATARAIAIPFATFIHIQKYVLGRSISLPRALLYTSLFYCVFAVVVTICKDLSDTEGDRLYGFNSLPVMIGREKAFWICTSVPMTMYGFAVGIGAFCSSLPFKIVTILGHLLLVSLLLHRSVSTDLSMKGSDRDYYMFIWKILGHLLPASLLLHRSVSTDRYVFIWKLFLAEYFLVQFIR